MHHIYTAVSGINIIMTVINNNDRYHKLNITTLNTITPTINLAPSDGLVHHVYTGSGSHSDCANVNIARGHAPLSILAVVSTPKTILITTNSFVHHVYAGSGSRRAAGRRLILLDTSMYVCMYVYIYIYHTCIHTYIHTFMHAYIHAYIHTYVRTYIHTSIHPDIHTYITLHYIILHYLTLY